MSLDAIPSLMCLVVYCTLGTLILVEGSRGKWILPLVWLAVNVSYNAGFLGLWSANPDAGNWFDVLAGTTVLLAGPAVVLLSLGVLHPRIRAYHVFVPFAVSFVILAIAWVISSPRVTDRTFGLLQMPSMVAMNLIGYVVLGQAARHQPSARRRVLARNLLLIHIPAFTVATLSYYVAFFRFNVPGVHAWYGDLAVSAAVVLTMWNWNRFYDPATNGMQEPLDKVRSTSAPPTMSVFVSYSRPDRAWVEAMLQEIRAGVGTDNVTFFLDLEAVEGGDNVMGTIRRAISEATAMLVVLSSASVKSVWVDVELAMATFGVFGKRPRRVVPLLLQDCDVPAAISQFHILDFRPNAAVTPNDEVSVVVRFGL